MLVEADGGEEGGAHGVTTNEGWRVRGSRLTTGRGEEGVTRRVKAVEKREEDGRCPLASGGEDGGACRVAVATNADEGWR